MKLELTLSAEMSIAIGGQHLERSVFDGEEGHIECSASEIVHENVGFLAFLVHSESKRSGCWLVDDALNVQTGDGTSILREKQGKDKSTVLIVSKKLALI